MAASSVRGVAVREDDDVGAAAHLGDDLIAQRVDGHGQSLGVGAVTVGLEESVDDDRREALHAFELFDVADLRQFVDAQDR